MGVHSVFDVEPVALHWPELWAVHDVRKACGPQHLRLYETHPVFRVCFVVCRVVRQFAYGRV